VLLRVELAHSRYDIGRLQVEMAHLRRDLGQVDLEQDLLRSARINLERARQLFKELHMETEVKIVNLSLQALRQRRRPPRS